MKSIIAAAPLMAVATILAIALPGQQSQESLIQKRDHKLAAEWLKSAPWITDYDQARAQAKASGKLIFAYFTRSYSP